MVYSYPIPMTFNSLYKLVNKQVKATKKELKECIQLLSKQDKLEVVDDLYKYLDFSKQYDENQIYPTDFCYMSFKHRWVQFWKDACYA